MSHFALLAELLLIFFGLPVAFRLLPVRLPALPLLWVVAGYGYWQLWRDPTFDRRLLWNAGTLPARLPQILVLFAIAALLIWWAVRRWRPDLEFSFVRTHSLFWAAVIVLYPVLSVYPQGVLYRAFFFHRYSVLFPAPWAMITVSAGAFGFVHIIFRSRLAVMLTLLGGFLFAIRYFESGSLATSCFEHMLYGSWLFTVGLGGYLYTGTMATVGSVLRR